MTRRRPRDNRRFANNDGLIFMPPKGFLDHIDDHRIGMPDDSRIGMPDDSRIGMPDDSRIGMIDDIRIGMINDSRIGMPDDSRIGMPDDSRGKLGFVKVKNVALHYLEDECPPDETS